MTQTRTYVPEDITVSWKGILFQGFMDGTFVTATRDEKVWKKHTGAQGFTTRTHNANKGGKIICRIVQSSPTNDLLSTRLVNDEKFKNEVGSFLLKDLRGTTLVSAPLAWLEGWADVEFGGDVAGREWVFDTGGLKKFIGGSLV